MGTDPAKAANFLIDSFDVPNTSPPGFPPSSSGANPILLNTAGQTETSIFTGLDQNEVIGGSRRITSSITQTSPLDAPPKATIGVFTGSGNFDGELNIDNRVRTSSQTVLEYLDLTATGQGNFNMLSGANNERGIKIDYTTDGIAFNFQLMLSDGTNMSTVSQNIDTDGFAEGSALFSFEDILAGGGGLDNSFFNNINYVKLVITGDRGYDLAINQIGSYEVPEPSVILGLLTVLGTGAFSLKRKTKAE